MPRSTNDGERRSGWSFEREFALRFCEAAGTPIAQSAYMHLHAGLMAEFLDIPIQPTQYQEPKHFAEDYQVRELLRKSLNIPGSGLTERRAKALSKFLAAEAHNACTNTKLALEKLPEWFGTFSGHVLAVLGQLDDVALDRIAELSGFGPGANVGVRSDGLVPSIKYDTKPVVTPQLEPLLPAVMGERVADFWGDLSSKVSRVRGNHHFTVPKSWAIERCAAKEPLWNSFLQLGIGQYIVRRLKRFGVDLNDQRLNQHMAAMAYEWGLSTLDLSSASDLMCRELVYLALCYNNHPQGRRWFHLLNLARSPEMRIKGEWRNLEMFSSMGNGFTFPLETVIFLALVRTVVPPDDRSLCAVYGDDIIVPRAYASALIDHLEYTGFKVNEKKTCLAGTFFESCGTDWFKGQPVRPFYLHQDPSSGVPYPLQAANALRSWCIRVFGTLPARYASLWRWCKSQIPQAWRRPVPPSLGDTGLNVGLSEGVAQGVVSTVSIRRGQDYHGWEGFVIEHVRLVPVLVDRHSFGVLTVGLSAIGRTEIASFGMEPIRGLFGKPKTSKSVVLWEDDFAWP